MQHRFKKGFSTIELLISVGIMSVLMTAAFVQYNTVGDSARLNSESVVVIGMLRDMQNKALSPRRPSDISAQLEEDSDKRVCGYIMFKGQITNTQTLKYYGVYGTKNECKNAQDIVNNCTVGNIGGNCGGGVDITDNPIAKEQLTYARMDLDRSVFIQTPFAYTFLEDDVSAVTLTTTHRSNTSLDRNITIDKGGFITGQETP